VQWAFGGAELYQQILLSALGSAILCGLALIWTLGSERRKANIELRLKAISIAMPNTISLRRPRPQRRALPAAFLARLDSALPATGNRIRIPHLAATAILANATVGFATMPTEIPAALAVALIGAATVAAPAFLVQLAQTRSQHRFLDIFPDAPDVIIRAVRGGLPILEAIAGASILGWRCPEFVLSRLTKRRRVRLENGMPDAIDLLVVCAGAGLSLDHAIEQVGQFLHSSSPGVAKEFSATAARRWRQNCSVVV
jgi:Flp pilus assembly protein TadB